MATGKALTCSLETLQVRGKLFLEPGQEALHTYAQPTRLTLFSSIAAMLSALCSKPRQRNAPIFICFPKKR